MCRLAITFLKVSITQTHAWAAHNVPAGVHETDGQQRHFCPVHRACTLLDRGLQGCNINESVSSSSVDTAFSKPVNSWVALPSQLPQQQFLFLAVPTQSRPCKTASPKISWRFTTEAASKQGKVCPSAPLRPAPPVVLVPVVQLANALTHM